MLWRKKKHCGSFPAVPTFFFSSVFVLYLFPDFSPHTLYNGWAQKELLPIFLTLSMLPYMRLLVSLQMNIIHTMHSSLKGHFTFFWFSIIVLIYYVHSGNEK